METTRVITVDPEQPAASALAEAVETLACGEPVIVPTETVYGLACRPDIDGAVERIYRAKGRPEDKPLPRMVANVEQVRRIATDWPRAADRLAQAYWPGPLTLVLPTEAGTIAFRVPDHPVMLRLLEMAGAPLAVTSANRSGAPAALTAQEAVDALSGHVPLALDAGRARIAAPSTIVACHGADSQILRAGAVPSADILRIAGAD